VSHNGNTDAMLFVHVYF